MSHPLQNRQWIYRQQPDGVVGAEHYELAETALDTHLAQDEVLLAARYISVDPYMRINQAHDSTWQAPHPRGTVQSAGVVAQVLASRSPNFSREDWVLAYTGWQTFAKAHAPALTLIDTQLAPATTALGALGMPGRTAWFGLTEAGRPKAGETVVVSGAAGAVGSLVVQFAKRHGCTVLGIAGGADKCAFVRERLGADHTIDYKAHADAASLSDAIRRSVGGVDIYFDNVGGMVTDSVLPRINLRARIIVCGQISQYSGGLDQPELGPRFLHHLMYQRASIQGILARDYLHRMDEMLRIVGPWVASGEIALEEAIVDGFDLLPSALNGLFTGRYRGKVLVRV